MFLNGKGIDRVEAADLLTLIDRDEDKYFDFKRNAYIAAGETKMVEKQQWEFAADLSSFANANGGYIICGIATKGGRASELKGLGEVNTDLTINTLTQVAENQVEPRIPGLQIRAIELADKTSAIVIYIPQSFAGPHWVKGTQQFHSRRSNGKTKMDLDELRTAFNLSEGFVERIRAFRRERVAAISQSDTQALPISPASGAKMVVHTIPINSFQNSAIDLMRVSNTSDWVVRNTRFSLRECHFNLDGRAYPISWGSKTRGYIQIFRNGMVECVDLITPVDSPETPLKLNEIERISLEYIRSTIQMQIELKVEMPIAIFLSIVGVKNYSFEGGIFEGWFHPSKSEPLQRNEILFSEVIVEQNPHIDGDENNVEGEAKVMKPIFDILWNAGGWAASVSYNRNSQWEVLR